MGHNLVNTNSVIQSEQVEIPTQHLINQIRIFSRKKKKHRTAQTLLNCCQHKNLHGITTGIESITNRTIVIVIHHNFNVSIVNDKGPLSFFKTI